MLKKVIVIIDRVNMINIKHYNVNAISVPKPKTTKNHKCINKLGLKKTMINGCLSHQNTILTLCKTLFATLMMCSLTVGQ